MNLFNKYLLSWHQFLIFIILHVQVFSQTAQPPANGVGSQEDPYQIATLENLYWITQTPSDWDKNYIQTADIDASETSTWNDFTGWMPIGNYSIRFTGTYNGQGHTINGLHIFRTNANFQGFFGFSANATISNLGLTNIYIDGGNITGGLVGADSASLLINNFTTGEVLGYTSTVGGLAGSIFNSDLKNSFSICNVSGLNTIGGLVGFNMTSAIQNSYSRGNVGVSANVGGLVGENNGTILNCYSTGEINGFNNVGGMIGRTYYPNVYNSYWDIETSGKTTSDGGIGKTSAEMKDFYIFSEAGWDFKGYGMDEIWNIGNNRNDGYPYLSWQYSDDPSADFECIPNVITEEVTNITTNTSIVNSKITNKGNPLANEHGVCWNTTGNPTISDYKIDEGFITEAGIFSSEITGLVPNTLYYVRSFAKNEIGINYSDGLSFVTLNIDPIAPNGEGTVETPYLISNLNNLLWISVNSSMWDKHYLQTENINASETEFWNNGKGWVPIGNESINFSGSYDGGGYKIDGLYLNRIDLDHQGLFGYVLNATIQNLGVINLEITGKAYLGGLAGGVYGSEINNCFTSGNINSDDTFIGGLVGYSQTSKIKSCYSACNANGYNNIGGLVGYAINCEISDCYSTGNSSGNRNIAGLVGYIYDCSVSNCYSTGSMDGENIGGLIAVQIGSNITNCFWDMESSEQPTSIGGIGKNTSEMKSIYTFTDAGWSFKQLGITDTWNMGNERNSGYPYLNLQFPNDPGPFDIMPSIIIDSISKLDEDIDYATIHVNISNIGNPVSESYGICWNSSGVPDLDDNKMEINEMAEPGIYTFQITELDLNISHFVRAYIINDLGIKYSNERGFITYSKPEGIGTADIPYQIASLGNLYWVQQNSAEWDKHYIQTAEINAFGTYAWNTGEGWTPIGNNFAPFTGEYFGGDHCIDSLFIYRPNIDYQGLFGVVSGATISNLHLSNMRISGRDRTGGLTGISKKNSRIENVFCTGDIVGGYFTGGITGRNMDSSSIVNCYAIVNIHCTNNSAGGIVGENYNFSSISGSFSKGSVVGQDVIGGLAGWNKENSTISNCYSMSNVSGRQYIGGLTGTNYVYSSIINSFSNGKISGEFNLGGLNGLSLGISTITSSFWDKQTTGQISSSGGIGKPTSEMKTRSTFTNSGWSFKNTINNDSIWNIGNSKNDGYPYFNWQYPDDPADDPPVVTTQPISNINKYSAAGHGIITYLGVPIAEQHGFCWNITGQPTVIDDRTEEGTITETGTFSSEITGLTPSTTYYLRAYASNENGISYGEETSFTTKCYDLTVTIKPENAGTAIGADNYPQNTEVELLAIAFDGYKFINWTDENENEISSKESYIYLMPESDINLTANFKPIDYIVTIKVYPDEAGEVIGEGTYIAGDSVELIAIPTEKYQFEKWLDVYDEGLSTDSNYTFIMPSIDLTFTAQFIQNPTTKIHPEYLSTVMIYPNPCTNSITIENAIDINNLVMTNVLGQKIIEIQANTLEKVIIRTNLLHNGIYFLTLFDKNGHSQVRRILKQADNLNF